jgi:predicted RNA-binding Zn ribbon-like protein
MDTLWLDLLNSDWHDYLGGGRHEDRLENLRWLGEFLSRWNLAPGDVSSLDTRRDLKTLRAFLSRMVGRLREGKPLRDRDVAQLNAFLASGPVVRRVQRDRDGFRLRLVAGQGLRQAVLSGIAASFAQMLVEGDPSRIKICENPDCKWVIYDQSRNRTRRWCEGATGCGNLLKVRRFRERQKKSAGATPPSSAKRSRRRSGP